MSTDEMDLQFARLTRSVKQSRQVIANLEAKISLFFADASSAERARSIPVFSPGTLIDPKAIIAKLEALPPISEIIESLNELDQERKILGQNETLLKSVQP
jgi:hypothetical protein